jgi:hypothetical protein
VTSAHRCLSNVAASRFTISPMRLTESETRLCFDIEATGCSADTLAQCPQCCEEPLFQIEINTNVGALLASTRVQ